LYIFLNATEIHRTLLASYVLKKVCTNTPLLHVLLEGDGYQFVGNPQKPK